MESPGYKHYPFIHLKLLLETMEHQAKPPGLFEIYFLPLIGAVVIESVHTRKTELYVFFLPFLLAGIRLLIAEFQLPLKSAGDISAIAASAFRNCIALNQIAVFVLILFETGVVLASSPPVPSGLWVLVAAFFGLYIALRLSSRRFWIVASEYE